MSTSETLNNGRRSKIRGALCALGMTLLITGPVLMPQKAEATGFPTVDIAALIQRILSYITQLSGYAEQLTQTTTQIKQLEQIYKDYEQTLKEYNDFLAQVRGLEHFISAADWNTLLQVLEPYYGKSAFAAIPNLDYKSATFDSDVSTIYGSIGAVPMKPETLNLKLAELGIDDTGSYTAANASSDNLFKRQEDLVGIVAANQKAAEDRKAKIDDLADTLDSLGDKSEVASLQFIAFEMNKMLHMQNEQMVMQNQQLMMTDLETTRRAQQRAEYLQNEITRLENDRDHPIGTTDFDNPF